MDSPAPVTCVAQQCGSRRSGSRFVSCLCPRYAWLSRYETRLTINKAGYVTDDRVAMLRCREIRLHWRCREPLQQRSMLCNCGAKHPFASAPVTCQSIWYPPYPSPTHAMLSSYQSTARKMAKRLPHDCGNQQPIREPVVLEYFMTYHPTTGQCVMYDYIELRRSGIAIPVFAVEDEPGQG